MGLQLPPQPQDLHVDRAFIDLRAVQSRQVEELVPVMMRSGEESNAARN